MTGVFFLAWMIACSVQYSQYLLLISVDCLIIFFFYLPLGCPIMINKLQTRRIYVRFTHIPLVPQRKQNEASRAMIHGHVVVPSDPVPDIDKTVYAHASGFHSPLGS
jgi:hypothetical protein